MLLNSSKKSSRQKLLFTALVGLLSATAPLAPAFAGAINQPISVSQIPTVYSFKVGAAKISALSDGTAALDLHKLLKGASEKKIDDLLDGDFLANPVHTSINAYLVQIGDRKLLIDTGTGDLFGPETAGKLPGALAAINVAPAQISDVLITHVHTDHIGGLVRGGKIMFPNATVHLGQPDLDFFLRDSGSGADASLKKEASEMLGPYDKAGKVKGFTGTAEIAPGLTGTVHPGHTPGSAFYTLDSEGQKIIFVGDIVHSAVQFQNPEITIIFDTDQKVAEKTREAAFKSIASERQLIAAPHLPFPGVGYIKRAGKAYEWVQLNYADWPSK
ncbi:MBL fold metallo-hydrolase [Rhizobium sp. SG570]|uniref:MBL fold metallo-hydrolase n=1 Tax=Rhizobium sp. SG570 TaxID=2587113 RepID=UPI001446AE7F|nr:MBL fold metallo-hydrolase [Rhizobium sp. SG570]NKJ38412.1 glyoxylase-like metal-dependent hydrolase (beta-lactamase superfamily II) [Rhizobium sp. SG570]